MPQSLKSARSVAKKIAIMKPPHFDAIKITGSQSTTKMDAAALSI